MATDSRLADFRRIWAQTSDLFAELAFCILTPQSQARACWPAILITSGARRVANTQTFKSGLEDCTNNGD